jgi:large repetitive protein
LNPRLRSRSRSRDAAHDSALHAGDLVLLVAPDASIDLDAKARPVLSVSGPARVTIAASDGSVLADETVTKRIVVPPRAALVGVQAGGSTSVNDGLAGWHERSRLGRFNARVALGPGCTLQTEGTVREAAPAWLAGSEVVGAASAVTTRFTAAVKTLVVVLAGAEVPSLTETAIELEGAARATNGRGAERTERPPRLVMAGDRAHLIYDVVAARDAAVTVRVQPGGSWRLAGVLGGEMDSETVARAIAVRGVAAIAARLLVAADGEPIAVTWEPPPAPRGAPKSMQKPPTGSAKKATVKSATGATTKTASKKATKDGKTSVNKTVGRKNITKRPGGTGNAR